MIKQLLIAGFLATGLLACAPNQTTSKSPRGREILKPGQVWLVQGITATGQTERFSITIPEQPGLDRNGAIAYLDRLGSQVANGIQSLTNIYYGPADSKPEFLNVGWIRTNLNSKESTERLCYSWIMPEQTNFERLEGKYALSIDDLAAYVKNNDTSRMGTCTITLQK